jgi:hypothetical protein
MNLRVRILYFADGVVIGGRQSLSSELVPGVPCAKSIRRLPGDGYLIDFSGKLYVVHDAQVRFAEVVDEDAKVEEPAAAPSIERAKPQEPLPTVPRDPTDGLKPGDLYMNERGVYGRVPYPPGMTKETYEESLRHPGQAPEPARPEPKPFKPSRRRAGPAPSKVDEK